MLAHDDLGHGPTVVLLHGFCEDRTLWNFHLSELRKEFRVINIDLPGFGENTPLQEAITIDELADEVIALINKMDSEQVVLVGHSLGGYIGLSILARQPSLLKGLCLFHSTAFADSEEKKENRDKTIAFIEKHGVEMFAKSFVPPLFNPSIRESLEEEINDLTKVAAATSSSTVIEVTKAMRDRPDRIEVLAMSNVPVSYIIGKADQAVPLEASLAQCYLSKDSQAHFLEKTGHMGMIERPEETLSTVRNFVNYCEDICE